MPRREIHSWLMDVDGVLVREEEPIPGATGEDAERHPYRPSRIIDSIADLIPKAARTSRSTAPGLDVVADTSWPAIQRTDLFRSAGLSGNQVMSHAHPNAVEVEDDGS